MNIEPASFGSLFLVALIAALFLFIGKKNRFFVLDVPPLLFSIRWVHVFFAFGIYFMISFFIIPIIGKAFVPLRSSSSLVYFSWLNFLNSNLILACLVLFFAFLPKVLRKAIWINPHFKKPPYFKDFLSAALFWVIAFPVVLFINQFFDFLLYSIFHIQHLPEQLAVYFLKMTFGHPFYLFMTILTIVLYAPVIEELLFRGFLQSFIRQNLGSKQAIMITSLLFAFFHYSPEQGISNLTIIASLFVFSLFISMIYEKRQSLFAAISLHAIFNLFNIVNLYFFTDPSSTSV